MQKKYIIGLALIFGIGIAIFSYTMINKQVENATQTVEVVVLKNDVEAYSAINTKNITTKSVMPNIVDEYTVVKAEDIIGQATATPIYAGKPIDIRNMVDAKEDIENKQVVGIFVDAARFAGVTEGDIVDVYRITAATVNPSPCVASNARVLKITDSKGSAIKTLVAETKKQVAPSIVYLLVKPEEVPFVIQGSVAEDKTYLSLAKKSKESLPVPVVEAVE